MRPHGHRQAAGHKSEGEAGDPDVWHGLEPEARGPNGALGV
jgi:hypothetical protein